MQHPVMANLIHTLWPSKAKGESTSSEKSGDTTQPSLKRKFDDMDGLYSSDTIDIVVGPANRVKTFKSHRNLLIGKSLYFQRKLKHDPSKSSFSFDDEEVEIYERVQEWLYSGNITSTSENVQQNRYRFSPASSEIPSSATWKKSESPTPSEKQRADFRKQLAREDSHFADQFVAGDSEPEDEEAPYPLDSFTLTKLYTLAERLKIEDLCFHVMLLLRDRLKYDPDLLGRCLIYAFKRCQDPESLLRRELAAFAATADPIGDFMWQLDPDDLSKELMFELLSKVVVEMAELRG